MALCSPVASPGCLLPFPCCWVCEGSVGGCGGGGWEARWGGGTLFWVVSSLALCSPVTSPGCLLLSSTCPPLFLGVCSAEGVWVVGVGDWVNERRRGRWFRLGFVPLWRPPCASSPPQLGGPCCWVCWVPWGCARGCVCEEEEAVGGGSG